MAHKTMTHNHKHTFKIFDGHGNDFSFLTGTPSTTGTLVVYSIALPQTTTQSCSCGRLALALLQLIPA